MTQPTSTPLASAGTERPLITVVSPVYRGEFLVAPLVERIVAALEPLSSSFEIILVNDASPDASWSAIEASCALEPRVVGVNLSRNYGQHTAIRAGLRHSTGDWVVVMDCDLQDRPEEIPRLYACALDRSCDVVIASRVNKQFGFAKRLTSWLFYRVLAFLTRAPQDPSLANFGVYRRPVIDAINSMNQHTGFFPSMVREVGFAQTTLEVEHASRQEGESSYRFGALLSLALNVILASSDRPLYLVVYAGVLIAGVGFLYGFYLVYATLTGQFSVDGWPSLMVSIWFLSGVNMVVIGVVGLYVGRVFEQVQRRPFFIVSEVKRT